MRTDNHDVRSDMEVFARAVPGLVRHPSTDIHVGDSDLVDVRITVGKALLYPVQECGVEAPWLIVRITRNRREAGPFVRSFAKKPVFTSRRRWPIEQSRILSDECGTGAQCVRDLLRVSPGQSI